jgi:hypothetical protein
MTPLRITALRFRARTESTDGQTSGGETRLSHIGAGATDLDDHAVEREENALEGRSTD